MRDIKLTHEGEWIVLVITGTRAGKERVRHIYLRRDEAAMVVSLLSKELERG